MNRTTILLAILALTCSTSFTVLALSTDKPITFTGKDIHQLEEGHFQAKVTVDEASKVRCVAYNGDAPVGIDSIAIYEETELANFMIHKEEGPVDRVDCWVTSTRAEDMREVEKIETNSRRKRFMEENNLTEEELLEMESQLYPK